MKSLTLAQVFAVLATAALAALGGGFAVFCAYDDAPGGVLIGIAMVIAAAFIGLRTVSRARTRHA